MAIEVKKPLCHMSHARCGLLATVEDGRITKLEGNPQFPVNAGRICERPKYGIEFHYHPDRVNYPQKRIGPRGSGKWERITWEQANTEIAAKMKELVGKYGAETLTQASGTGRTDDWYRDLFFNLAGSPNHNNGPVSIC